MLYGLESKTTRCDMNKGSDKSCELPAEMIKGARYLKMVGSMSSEQHAMRLKADLMV